MIKKQTKTTDFMRITQVIAELIDLEQAIQAREEPYEKEVVDAIREARVAMAGASQIVKWHLDKPFVALPGGSDNE